MESPTLTERCRQGDRRQCGVHHQGHVQGPPLTPTRAGMGSTSPTAQVWDPLPIHPTTVRGRQRVHQPPNRSRYQLHTLLPHSLTHLLRQSLILPSTDGWQGATAVHPCCIAIQVHYEGAGLSGPWPSRASLGSETGSGGLTRHSQFLCQPLAKGLSAQYTLGQADATHRDKGTDIKCTHTGVLPCKDMGQVTGWNLRTLCLPTTS